MNNNCIELLGLNYLHLFSNFSIALEKEKFITISGANNCGKTTLIRIISGQVHLNNTITLYDKPFESYKVTEIANIIQSVIPLELTYFQNTVENEMLYQISNDITKSERNKLIKEIAKTFKLTKLLTKSVESLKNKEKIYLQLALAIIKNPKIILVDDLSLYFSKQELLEITKSLYEYNQKYKTTIIMVTSVLECNLLSDYTYIISNGEIVLEGNPKEVLEKDNILNKAGLNLPFMMDLSVKLRDYDLIENIELDMDRLVNTLWK
jgi:ABC-type cobalamin/Fe3+-siderophores transport system ATPase subunit